jgi:hypothetical protein
MQQKIIFLFKAATGFFIGIRVLPDYGNMAFAAYALI